MLKCYPIWTNIQHWKLKFFFEIYGRTATLAFFPSQSWNFLYRTLVEKKFCNFGVNNSSFLINEICMSRIGWFILYLHRRILKLRLKTFVWTKFFLIFLIVYFDTNAKVLIRARAWGTITPVYNLSHVCWKIFFDIGGVIVYYASREEKTWTV